MVGETEQGYLISTPRGLGLWLLCAEGNLELISARPGSGRDAVACADGIVFKEILPDDRHRIVMTGPDSDRIIAEGPALSGPFPAGDDFLWANQQKLALADADGEPIRSWPMDGLVGSACLGGSHLVYTDADGGLFGVETGQPRSAFRSLDPGGAVAAVRPYSGDTVLVEYSGGGFGFYLIDGGIVSSFEEGFFPSPTPEGAICALLEGSGAAPDSGCLLLADASTGAARRIATSGPPAGAMFLDSGRLVYTDLSQGEVVGLDVPVIDWPPEYVPGGEREAWFDVPYMHQRWDTPDWFDGSWSCGPTSCMMACQYYNRLTPDSIWCSYPSPGHWSEWGEYIPNQYTFLGETYDIWGISPGNVWVQGAHGFICRDAGGAYWQYMIDWMSQHGLTSDYAGTAWSSFTAEADQSWPVVVSSTSIYTDGHILLFNGYYENHSVVCNDAYGDQNQPGWGNYYNGKDVIYDWYPYNNGNVQVHIAQLFLARDTVLCEADTLVDDYSWGFEKLGPCQYYHEVASGYRENAWWTYSTGAPPDTCTVRWTPQLPGDGTYEVLVHIPEQRSTAFAIYRLETSMGPVRIGLDQSLYSNQWASLGTWHLEESDAQLVLGDFTGTQGEYLAFDAARFHPLPGGMGDWSNPIRARLSVYPNPCSGSTVVGLPGGFEEWSVSVWDLSGRRVYQVSASHGADNVSIPVSDLAPGVYLVTAEGNQVDLRSRFVVVR